MNNNLVQRSITGVFFVATIVAMTLASQWSFFILIFAINFLCLLEFFELLLPNKSWIEKYFGIIAGSMVLLMFAMIFSANLNIAWYYHLIPVFLILFILKLFENSHNEFETLSFQLLGFFYITLPLVMLAKMGYLNSLEYSSGLPMGFFILLWTNDTGAYFAGSKLGKHKLFERLSPKKTWEGFMGGLILAMGVGYLLSRFELFDAINTIDWIILGMIVAVFGTLGDLFESLLKRNLHIKDSGTILPGHGGVLDRFDGLFLSVPAVFFYLLLTT